MKNREQFTPTSNKALFKKYPLYPFVIEIYNKELPKPHSKKKTIKKEKVINRN